MVIDSGGKKDLPSYIQWLSGGLTRYYALVEKFGFGVQLVQTEKYLEELEADRENCCNRSCE